MDASNIRTNNRKFRKEVVVQWKIIRSKVRAQPVLKYFSGTPLENSGGAENAAENSGTKSKNFICYVYELSLWHLVWAVEINVTPCNSAELAKVI